MSIGFKFFTLFTDRLVGHLNAPIEHHFLDIAIAQGKGVVEPSTMIDDPDRKSMVLLAGMHCLTPKLAAKAYHES